MTGPPLRILMGTTIASLRSVDRRRLHLTGERRVVAAGDIHAGAVVGEAGRESAGRIVIRGCGAFAGIDRQRRLADAHTDAHTHAARHHKNSGRMRGERDALAGAVRKRGAYLDGVAGVVRHTDRALPLLRRSIGGGIPDRCAGRLPHISNQRANDHLAEVPTATGIMQPIHIVRFRPRTITQNSAHSRLIATSRLHNLRLPHTSTHSPIPKSLHLHG